MTVPYLSPIYLFAQETQREQMTRAQVESRLSARMGDAFEKVFDRSRDQKISLRKAALRIAIEHLIEGIQVRGFLP